MEIALLFVAPAIGLLAVALLGYRTLRSVADLPREDTTAEADLATRVAELENQVEHIRADASISIEMGDLASEIKSGIARAARGRVVVRRGRVVHQRLPARSVHPAG